jgi:hypothetical protein
VVLVQVAPSTRTRAPSRHYHRCGGEAQGNGSNLLVDAEAKGEEIKAKAG